MIDAQITNEINKLKAEIEQKEILLSVEKENYMKNLLSTIGGDMMKELENPPKPSLMLKWKILFARWKKKCYDKNILKKGTLD